MLTERQKLALGAGPITIYRPAKKGCSELIAVETLPAPSSEEFTDRTIKLNPKQRKKPTSYEAAARFKRIENC